MANYNTLISAIQTVITQNGNNEITGNILQQTLLAMISSLGAGYQFVGVAQPSTNPGTPDQKVFYIASNGTFPNFGPTTVPPGYLGIFKYDSSWHYETLEFPIGDGTITTQKVADGAINDEKIANNTITVDKLSQALREIINHPVAVENGTNDVDLDITDALDNILVRFQGGHIRTKRFDSANIPHPVDVGDTNNDADLEFCDESGKVLVRFENGQIRTKEFNSADLYKNTIFTQKKFSFIGDSITTFSGEPGVTNTYYPHGDITAIGQMWWSILTNLCKANICRISATGGSCITDGYGTAPSFQQRYNALFSGGTTGNAPDYIFVLGGINDWNTGAALGNYTDSYLDSSLPTTFIPSFRRFLYNLQVTYPNAEIIVLTPIRAYYGTLSPSYPPTKSGRNLNDYADAICKCCELHGVVCIDIYNLLNLNLQNIDTYTNDKLHPKANLMEKVAKLIYQQIITIF